VLFIGDDWAEGHHDIELEDEAGRRLARARLPEGLEGITRLHALVAEHAPGSWAELPPDQVAGQVIVGIETDRGPWVTALRAAGYQVFAINPLSAARYRQRHSTSGAKSDAGDAHVLAEIVRLDRDHHRPIAGDSDLADAVKLLARAHQIAVWERTRQVLRVDEHFARHPAADIYLSQPGFGVVLAARTLGEFGDDKDRFATARARKNYSGQSPITRASGKKSVVLARYATNRRLGAALHLQAFAALGASPGARAYYDAIRARNIGHHAALRQLANRFVGILHGCLKTGTLYDENTAWQHHRTDIQPAAA